MIHTPVTAYIAGAGITLLTLQLAAALFLLHDGNTIALRYLIAAMACTWVTATIARAGTYAYKRK